MPCLTTCCCGFTVRAGTRAIAILSLVYSVLGLLMVGTYNFGLDRQRLYERQMHGWPTNSNPSFHGVVDTRELSLSVPQAIDGPITAYKDDLADYEEEDEEIVENSPGPDKDLENYQKKRRLEMIMSVYSVAVSVNIVVSLSLFIGVKLEKRWLLMPWVAWNTLSLIASQMAIFVVPNKSPIIPDIFSTGLSIYCIMCVCSYFQTLSSSAPARQTQTTWTGAPPPPPAPPSPRPPLTVQLPADLPPAYQPADLPPTYDPPPPYPGSPGDKSEDPQAGAATSGNENFNKHIP